MVAYPACGYWVGSKFGNGSTDEGGIPFASVNAGVPKLGLENGLGAVRPPCVAPFASPVPE